MAVTGLCPFKLTLLGWLCRWQRATPTAFRLPVRKTSLFKIYPFKTCPFWKASFQG
jgi:hypothetical protein